MTAFHKEVVVAIVLLAIFCAFIIFGEMFAVWVVYMLGCWTFGSNVPDMSKYLINKFWKDKE